VFLLIDENGINLIFFFLWNYSLLQKCHNFILGELPYLTCWIL